MKKLIVALSVFVAIASKAQEVPLVKDSVKLLKNEIGFNLLPVVNFISGSTPNERSRYSLNYRRYLNEVNALRFSISAFPYESFNSFKEIGVLSFYQLSDTNLIYKHVQNEQKAKLQLNIGYERVWRTRRIINSVGTDGFINYQHLESKEAYYWSGKSSPLPSTIYDANKGPLNKVDTLGTNRIMDRIGVGIHPFYNLRIPVTKHWLLSTTIGPCISMYNSRDKVTSARSGGVTKFYVSNFDFEAVLLTDLSICYRF